jgi:hypothetical protein
MEDGNRPSSTTALGISIDSKPKSTDGFQFRIWREHNLTQQPARQECDLCDLDHRCRNLNARDRTTVNSVYDTKRSLERECDFRECPAL